MRRLSIFGKEDIRLEEEETPEPEEGQVRIRVTHVGICGSDLHYYYDGANGAFVVREPLSPGHEMSGVVDFDPSGKLKPGTPVTVHPATFGDPQVAFSDRPHLWPNGDYLGSASTWPHTQGAMSDFLLMDAERVYELPEELPLNRAALVEPLAVALHGLSFVDPLEGQSVLVTGAGPIGLLTAAAAKFSGAEDVTITDVLPGPLQRAQALGIDNVINVRSEEIPANSYDVVLECSGTPPAINAAIVGARPAGAYVQIGMLPAGPQPIDLAPMISKELSIHGSFRFNDEIEQAIEMLTEHEVFEELLTHEFPVTEAEEAFAVAKDSEVSGKVLVNLLDED